MDEPLLLESCDKSVLVGLPVLLLVVSLELGLMVLA